MPGDPAHRPRLLPLRLARAGRRGLVAAGLALTAALALLLVVAPRPVRLAELRAYDLMLGARPPTPPSTRVVVVGIDDESLAARGQWPWPRYRLAMLVERLLEAGAAVVALDLLLPEPDRSSPEVIRAERARDGLEPGAATGDDDNSRRLAAALRRGDTVLACQLGFTPGVFTLDQPAPSAPAGLVVTASPSAGRWPEPTSVLRSLPQLTAAATAEGFANTLKDPDGTLRRTPLLLSLHGQPVPSLALATVLLTSTDRTLRHVGDGGARALVWGARSIPLDDAGNMLLDVPDAPRVFVHRPARAVLDGEVAAEELRGRVVLVGAWATGMGDLHLVPSGRWARGLEVHAAAVEALLTGRFIARPGWARGAELVALVLLGLASTLLLSRSGFKLSLGAVVVGSAGCWWGATRLLAGGLYLSPLLPMLTPVVITTVLSLLKYGVEARKVEEGIRDLVQAQDEIIVSMSVLSEARDRETGLHILRTKRYVELLARQLATTPRYRALGEASIALLAKSAPLHDIGKVGISDEILHKPGKLTDDEYAVMRSHTTIGANALTEIVDTAGAPEKNEFLAYAREMTIAHHERWDGSGYPRGLRGEEIPLAGRLMALADVYDALVSRRAYKEAFTHEQAREHIRRQAGSHFDPDVVAAFLARDAEFLEVARRFADTDDPEALRRAEVPPA